MKFKLEIDCDNAAFEPNASREVSRILRHVVKRVELERNVMRYGVIMDENGNKVGKWEIV